MNASRRSKTWGRSRFETSPESTRRSAGPVGAVLLLCLGMPGLAGAGVEHERMCNVGLNLGAAYGRLVVFGSPGFAVTPPDQVAAIATNLRNASAEIAAFEPLVNTLHISPGRTESVRLIRADLERMARDAANLATRDASRVGSIKGRYKQGLTYVNRDGHLDLHSTCDSCLLDACYHFAAAHVSSVIEQVGPRRTLLNRHLGMMRNAIRSGINLSWDNITGTYDTATGTDRPAYGGVRTLRRMCCPFGREAGWEPLLNLGPNATWAEFTDLERYLQRFVREIRAVNCEGNNQSESESEKCPPGHYLGIDGTCAKIGGAVFGGTTVGDGYVNQSFIFDGIDDYMNTGNHACFGGARYPESWRSEASCGGYGCNFGRKNSVEACLRLGASKGAAEVVFGLSGRGRDNECWLQTSCANKGPHASFSYFVNDGQTNGSCPRNPDIVNLEQQKLYYFPAVVPWPHGTKCMTDAQKEKSVRDDIYVIEGQCPPVCPYGYYQHSYKGKTVCLRCPPGMSYRDNCCN